MHTPLPQPDPPITGLSDPALLRRFVQDADQDAFAEIVRRYHGLVMSVCRRVMGPGSDVDDAFQATFLVLARRPRGIRRADSISAWLYTVAWRTSVRMMRQRRKQPVDSPSLDPPDSRTDPLDQIARAQDLLVLDEELNQLPPRYHNVLVMTYFAQHTNQQVADQLNVSRGTVDGRLKRARNILRVKLARRGVSLGVLAVAVSLVSRASAATPSSLLLSTTQLGIQTLNGTLSQSVDLSHLEPLIRPETAMISSKFVITGAICATALAGAFGLQGLSPEDFGSIASAQPATLSGEIGSDQQSGTNSSAGAVAILQGNAALSDISSLETEPTAAAMQRNSRPVFSALPSEQWLHKMLDEPVPLLDFQGETPLKEILEFLANYYTEDHGHDEFRMMIWEDTAELQDSGIDLDDVLVNDIRLEGLTLENALELILERANKDLNFPLTYIIQNQVLKITTVDQAENLMDLRSYPIAHLLEAHPDLIEPISTHRAERNERDTHRGGGSFSVTATLIGEPDEEHEEELEDDDDIVLVPPIVTLVEKMTSPTAIWQDLEGEGGSISLFGTNLIVRQNSMGHREVVRLLTVLKQSTR